MTDTQRRWDRLTAETPKSYAAFLAYVALGARRSVREAARQYCVKTISKRYQNHITGAEVCQKYVSSPAPATVAERNEPVSFRRGGACTCT